MHSGLKPFIYMFRMTDSRLEAVFIILVSFIPFIYKRIKFDNPFVKFYLKYSMLLACFSTFVVELLYLKYPNRLSFLNDLMSKRLSITAEVIRQNGFHLLGKSFFMQGFGTWQFDWKLGYNFVDSFYINYTLQYGIIFMAFIIILYTIICRDLYANKEYFLLILFSICVIHGMFISSIFLPQCNPFFMVLFAEWINIRKKTSVNNNNMNKT